MAFLKDIDDWMFGGARRRVERTEEQHQDNRKRIESLLKTSEAQRLLSKARAASLDRGEGYYGGRGVDPRVKGAEDLGKIRTARDKFAEDELSPETAAYFDAAEKSVLNRMKVRDNREDFVRPSAPSRVGNAEVPTSKSAAEYFQPIKPRDETDVFEALGKKKKGVSNKYFPKDNEWLRTGEVSGVKQEKEGQILADYFQAPTETVPESNIPKTYEQLGITNVDDMASLQEMQDALPEIDMKSEYEADPEGMKKLIELWRAKKLTKQNLHKAFSMIQQTAQQALGIG